MLGYEIVAIGQGVQPAADFGDIWEIDLPRFTTLVSAMFTTRAATSHMYFMMMLDGILPVSVAMLYRAGGTLTPATTAEHDLLAGIQAMRLPMSR